MLGLEVVKDADVRAKVRLAVPLALRDSFEAYRQFFENNGEFVKCLIIDVLYVWKCYSVHLNINTYWVRQLQQKHSRRTLPHSPK